MWRQETCRKAGPKPTQSASCFPSSDASHLYHLWDNVSPKGPVSGTLLKTLLQDVAQPESETSLKNKRKDFQGGMGNAQVLTLKLTKRDKSQLISCWGQEENPWSSRQVARATCRTFVEVSNPAAWPQGPLL